MEELKQINVQIRYADKFGANAGCMTVRLPEWLDEPRVHQRRFYILAAQHADQFENRHEIAALREYIEHAIRAAKEAVKEAETAERPNREDWARRASDRPEGKLKRYEQALKDLDASISIHDPEAKKR